MATAAQMDANRLNAQNSTGPRTPEGKERASQNALKHGLFARGAVIRGEDEDEFELHRESLLDQLMPRAPLEEILADRIVDLSWRLKRAAQDQSDAFAALYEKYLAQQAGSAGGTGIPSASLSGQALPVNSNPGQARPEPGERDAQATAGMIGRMILEDFSRDAVLERLLRYERRIENSLYRTLNELRRVHDQLQKASQEEVTMLERWRDEDWEAKKAWAFARCRRPEVSEEASSEKRSFQCEVSSVKLEEPAADPGSLPTSNFTLQTFGPAPDCPGQNVQNEPNLGRGFKCEVSSVKRQVRTSNFPLQT